MSKEIKGYVLILKSGEVEDRIIRGISRDGGEILAKLLTNDPPQFIEVKGRLIATSAINQLVPIY